MYILQLWLFLHATSTSLLSIGRAPAPRPLTAAELAERVPAFLRREKWSQLSLSRPQRLSRSLFSIYRKKRKMGWNPNSNHEHRSSIAEKNPPPREYRPTNRAKSPSEERRDKERVVRDRVDAVFSPSS